MFIDWYLPGFKAGGPIRSVANMYSQLKDHFHFRIVCSDRDLHADKPYQGITTDTWTKGPDGSDVLYLSSARRNYREIEKIIREERADFIYLNSVFSKVFTIYPLLARKRHFPTRKVIIAPRGMLGKGALQIKPIKKKFFLLWSRLNGLYSQVRWHASSTDEEKEIKSVFGTASRTTVALNMSAQRTLVNRQRVKEQGKLKAVFLSRISIKKNLKGALELLAKTPSGMQVDFDVFGPVEDAVYWKECDELMGKLPGSVRAMYMGELPHQDVERVLQQYHLSILLTFNENFGHSIVESMAAGCPVLISDQTPWNDLEKKNAGWALPLSDTQRLEKAMIDMIDMDQDKFQSKSTAAMEYARGIIHHSEIVQQHLQLFS